MFGKKFYLIAFFLLQIFFALMVSIGVWPQSTVYFSLFLQAIAILLFDPEYALYSVILSTPFALAVPVKGFDTFSVWRINFAFFTLVYLIKENIIRFGKPDFSKLKFAPWDKYLLYFVLAIFLSTIFAPYKVLAIKKLLFVVNAYLIYFLVYNILRTRDQIKRAFAVVFDALFSVIVIGFLQYVLSLKLNIYYLWQYWATFPARYFYGSTFADTSASSNSWFSFVPKSPPVLRMFSILPDSHSFGLLALFLIPFAMILTYFAKNKWQRVFFWKSIFLTAWAVVLSGTRGIWVAIIPVLFLLIFLDLKRRDASTHALIKKLIAPILIVVVLIFVSPYIQKGLNDIFNNNAKSGLQRVESIYNLNDSSNSGRIFIWKNTLNYVAHHPITGAGFGNFIETLKGAVLPDADSNYTNLSLEREERFNLPAKYITAHNLYLDILAEVGILGFLAFALYFKSILSALYKFYKKSGAEFAKNPYVFYVLAFAIYLIWLLAYSFVDGTLLNDRVLIYFFVSLALAAKIINLENKNV
jgi:putative inorganic carbon (HCO3(-)) transporter